MKEPHENKQANLVFKSLKGRETSKEEIEQSLTSFCQYLNELVSKIWKKEPQERYVFDWIFRTDINVDQDLKTIVKCNLAAASWSFQRHLNELQKQTLSVYSKRILLDFICDLKPFVNYFDEDQDYTWLVGNTNTHISNFYHSLAKNTYFYGRPGDHAEEALVLGTSTPFLIRQSIEYKIKRILGIKSIKIDGKDDFNAMTKYWLLVKSNLAFYDMRNFDFKLVEFIYKWCHRYVHGGLRAFNWQTECAIDYLAKVFDSGQIVQTSQHLYTLALLSRKVT